MKNPFKREKKQPDVPKADVIAAAISAIVQKDLQGKLGPGQKLNVKVMPLGMGSDEDITLPDGTVLESAGAVEVNVNSEADGIQELSDEQQEFVDKMQEHLTPRQRHLLQLAGVLAYMQGNGQNEQVQIILHCFAHTADMSQSEWDEACTKHNAICQVIRPSTIDWSEAHRLIGGGDDASTE